MSFYFLRIMLLHNKKNISISKALLINIMLAPKGFIPYIYPNAQASSLGNRNITSLLSLNTRMRGGKNND